MRDRRSVSTETALGFETLEALIEQAMADDRKHLALLVVLREQVLRLEREHLRLVEIIERGNGHDPLIFQVSGLRAQVMSLHADLESWRQLRQQQTLEGMRGRWAAVSVGITAVGGLLLGLINLLGRWWGAAP